MVSSRTQFPEIVRQTPVVTDGAQLTVSTIRIAPSNYDTAVFDDSTDNRHNGWWLGGFVIDKSSKHAATRAAAMDDHREAVHAAHTTQPKHPAGAR